MERQDAAMAQKNQYRTSADQKQNRKIEEEYSMFDEHNVDEDELEDIIEQPIEEESCEGDSEDEANECRTHIFDFLYGKKHAYNSGLNRLEKYPLID